MDEDGGMGRAGEGEDGGVGRTGEGEDRLVRAHDDGVRIMDAAGRRRYEALLHDRVAGYADYRRVGDRLVFVHTVVAEWAEGRGIGSRLAEAALDDARARDLGITVHCPFIAGYIERHPQYADLIRLPGSSGSGGHPRGP